MKLIMFQFTHPVWGATSKYVTKQFRQIVSIHAPRVGCDNGIALCTCRIKCFNSRTPCGVRPRCPKVRINRGLDDDELRMGDYEWVYSVRWR